MALDTGERKEIDYFIGYEVEHTVCYGKKTLFVVGIKDVDTIDSIAKKNDCEQIYFGTSQSFTPVDGSDWHQWDKMIVDLLKLNYWVTLDFDVKYAEDVLNNSWVEYERFVPMISVKLPYIRQFNYNTTLKLDDNTWGHSNPGVWTHQLHDLMSKDKYTYWDQYTQDTEVK